MTALGRAPSAGRLVARLLESPGSVEAVQRLAPAALRALVDEVGLEDAGELVAMATTAQLARVFDEDVWRSDAPGQDERFDADRFLLWLEVLLEGGEDFVARTLVDLDDDFVTMAFHALVVVVDVDDLLATVGGADDGEQIDKALESTVYHEWEELQIIARRPDGWDTVLAALLALDREHHDHLRRLLDRCRHLTAAEIAERDGLHEVLTAAETLVADVAGARQDRRAREGHIAPSDAAALLARAASRAEPPAEDPIAAAYFRAFTPPPVPALRATPTLVPAAASPSRAPLLQAAMRAVAETRPHLLARRQAELALAANVLVAAAAHADGRPLRPVEAAQAAVALCELGLASAPGTTPLRGAGEDLVAAFQRGWRRFVHELDPADVRARGLDAVARPASPSRPAEKSPHRPTLRPSGG